MIKNEKQLKIAQTKRESLAMACEVAEPEDKPDYEILLGALDAEIASYEAIRSGQVRTFDITSLDELGEGIIKARIARRFTQRQFAEEMGVSEQLIQRDEARDFENAGLVRVAEMLDALEYEFVGTLRPKQHRFLRTSSAGLSKSNNMVFRPSFSPSPLTFDVTAWQDSPEPMTSLSDPKLSETG